MSGIFHALGIKILAGISSIFLLISVVRTAIDQQPYIYVRGDAVEKTATADGVANNNSAPATTHIPSAFNTEPTTPRMIGRTIEKAGFDDDILTKALAELRSDLIAHFSHDGDNSSVRSDTRQDSTFVSRDLFDKQTQATLDSIDLIADTSFSGITVNGVSGLTDADIPDSITVANYLPRAGGTVSGNLAVTGDVRITGEQTLSGALTVPHLSATSTTDTSILSGHLLVSGTTTLHNLHVSGSILSTLNVSSPPSSVGNWNSIVTAFSGDLSHLGLGISRQTTGTSLGSPTSGYSIVRELSAIASYSYNSSGHNELTSGSDGRTGALNFYAKNDNYGQGDSTSYFCDGFVGSTLSGATHFLASPQVACLGGQLFGGTNGSYLQGIGDMNLHDQGHDVAAIGLNFNFDRTNATGALNTNWGAWTFQNQGSLPIDWMLRATGPVRTALDLSALTFPDKTLVGVTLTNGGSGYSVGDSLSPPDGAHDQLTVIKVLTVNGSGSILTYGVDRAGLYSTAPTLSSSVSGGTGSGAVFTLQYSTASANPALVTKSDNCWYANASQDTGVYSTSFSSTLILGTSYACFSSSLQAWNFVTGNSSVLQLYSNQVIANTTLLTTGSVSIGTSTSPASTLTVSGGASIGAAYNTAAPTNGLIVQGDVGIGTTSPVTNFANAGNSYIAGGLGVGLLNTSAGTFRTSGSITGGSTLALTGTSGTTTIASGQGFTFGGSQFVVQLGTGRIGVNTSAPQALFSVQANSSNINLLHFTNISGQTLASLFSDNSQNGWFRLYNSSQTEQIRLSSNGVSYFNGGNLGVGSSTPGYKLSVTGTMGLDGLTGAFGAGSLCLTASKEVVYNSGSDSCLSSLRSTKHDISGLTVDALSQILALQPVSFIYNSDASSTVRYGFVAEDSAAVDSHLSTYDQDGKISGVDDRGLLSLVVKAMQDIISVTGMFKDKLISWLGSSSNNLGRVRANELCARKSDGTDVCVTGDELAAVMTGHTLSYTSSKRDDSQVQLSGSANSSGADITPPAITIIGDNPANINVGDTYTDAGVTATDNVDQTTIIRIFVGTTPIEFADVDTNAPATYHINYVATDRTGNSTSSTRTVVVKERMQAKVATQPEQPAMSAQQSEAEQALESEGGSTDTTAGAAAAEDEAVDLPAEQSYIHDSSSKETTVPSV